MKRFVAVEMPGPVYDTGRAVAALGGVESLAAAEAASAPAGTAPVPGSSGGGAGAGTLRLCLDPDNPYSHPLAGAARPAAALLVRVRRRRKRRRLAPAAATTATSDQHQHPTPGASGAGAVWEAETAEVLSSEIVGCVTKIYSFTEGLSDFQHTPASHFATEMRPEDDLLHPDFFSAEVPIEITPPEFCSRNKPYTNYNFRPNTSVKKARKKEQLQEVSFSDALPVPPALPSKLTPKVQALVETLREVFAKRRIWSRAALKNQVTPQHDWQTLLSTAIQYVAYQFSNGPWRSLLIAHAYDPRTDPTSRQFQVLDVRMNSASASKAKQTPASRRLKAPHPSSPGAAAAIQAESIPAHKFVPGKGSERGRRKFYQMCDVHSMEIQELLASQNVPSQCNEKTGWVSAEALAAMRKQLKELIEAEQAAPASAVPEAGGVPLWGEGSGAGGDVSGGALPGPHAATMAFGEDIFGADSDSEEEEDGEAGGAGAGAGLLGDMPSSLDLHSS